MSGDGAMENEKNINNSETKKVPVRQKQKKKDPNCYRFGKVLGEGSFSCVYLAKDIDSGREYAIKVCEKEHILREKKQEYVNREKEALNLLSNTKGIISLSCTFQDTRSLYFVLTFAPNGEILKLIRKRGCLNVATARFYASELLCAIENMSRKNIIHRDLKPENLLLTDDMHLMIADFGSAKILPKDYNYAEAQEEIDRLRAEESNSSDEEVQMTRRRKPKRRASFVGTAQYVSPEVLKGNAPHPASDLWAFGCVLYQMLVGSPPFRAGSEYLIFQKIQNRDFMYPNNFPDENAKDLITKLLQLNPEHRLGADDMHDQKYVSIRNHAFFDGVNWEEVFKHPPPEQIIDKEESSTENHIISDEIEPGLGQAQQLRMIFENDFVLSDNRNQSSGSVEVRSTDNNNQIQYDNDVTCFLIENETILRQGFVYKKKGLFPRRRLLILTNIPRLIYIDPTTNVQKGEIIFQNITRCEARNFRQFYVHTPNRIYNLEDTSGGALDWCEHIDRAKQYLNRSGSGTSQ